MSEGEQQQRTLISQIAPHSLYSALLLTIGVLVKVSALYREWGAFWGTPPLNSVLWHSLTGICGRGPHGRAHWCSPWAHPVCTGWQLASLWTCASGPSCPGQWNIPPEKATHSLGPCYSGMHTHTLTDYHSARKEKQHDKGCFSLWDKEGAFCGPKVRDSIHQAFLEQKNVDRL